MQLLIIRWIGAYGRSKNLHSSLQYELENMASFLAGKFYKEVSAQVLLPWFSGITKVGLLVAAKYAPPKRRYNADVDSFAIELKNKCKRVPRQDVRYSGVREAIVKPVYEAIVVNERTSAQVKRTARYFAKKYNLLIAVRLKDGRLVRYDPHKWVF